LTIRHYFGDSPLCPFPNHIRHRNHFRITNLLNRTDVRWGDSSAPNHPEPNPV
jgi:hypothetical protein